jgi:hypothetical protein
VVGGVTGSGDRGLLVVASPLGLHALRLTDAAGRVSGEVVVALEGPTLRPVTAGFDGRVAGAGAPRDRRGSRTRRSTP